MEPHAELPAVTSDGASAPRAGTCPAPPEVAPPIAEQVAAGLPAAHLARGVRRDLEPENVLLVPDDGAAAGTRAGVNDFAISGTIGGEPEVTLTTVDRMIAPPARASARA